MSVNFNKSSKDVDKLQARIMANQNSQKFNLENWIFQDLINVKFENILELCAGTGRQSEKLSHFLVKEGRLNLLDVSADACSLLTKKFAGNKNVKIMCKDLDEYLLSCRKKFDLIFVSYGLYYSKCDELQLAQSLSRMLSDRGSLIVVGPYIGNNMELFDVLKKCGVNIPVRISYCCEKFMNNFLLSMLRHSCCANINLANNKQRWDSADSLLKYWENTTFYDFSLRDKVLKSFQNHFKNNNKFIVTKRIAKMLFNKIG
jgi:ubiquinone/menaquinone biosynthesis C-methylase UbiE